MNEVDRAASEEQRQREPLSDRLRARTAAVLQPVGRFLAGLGIHPNTVTLVGFVLQTGVGALFALGHGRWGGLLLLVVAPLDALDGAVARAGGNDSPFGAFLDSTVDRFSDAVLILGLTVHRYQEGLPLEVGLLMVALVAALMVSYTRARAEALGLSCKVGLLTRMERILLIAVLSALGLFTVLVWALAILSAVTVVQRVVHVYRACSSRE